jgi:glycosyltransferase involved in cell wall biosynthesis
MTAQCVAFVETIARAGGGAQISLLELIRAVRGKPRIVVVLPEDGPLRELIVQAGAEVRILPWPDEVLAAGERLGGLSVANLVRAMRAAFSIPALVQALRKTLEEVGADVVITNGIKAHVLGALGRGARPLVWFLREGQEGRVLSSAIMRVLGGRCSGAIAISRFVEREARSLLPKRVPIQVLYNLVDFTQFSGAAPAPADLQKGDREVWFCMIGALTPLKGQDLFLEAASSVALRVPDARFVIVGSNFYKTETNSTYARDLNRMADNPSLRGRVMFLGQREDVPSLLRLIDVLVQPNRGPEGLGRSVLEAMSCAIPVIAVNRWGPAELISDGETGLLFPPLDVAALADKMERLALDSEERHRLGKAAQGWVRRELDRDRIVERFRQFIEVLTK